MGKVEDISVLSLFSGLGAYEKALEKIGIGFNVVGYCEKDSATAKCYSVIHGVDSSMNLSDVSKIVPSELPDFDLLTFSPPCQDISAIGQHAGVHGGTRTSLMWKCLDIIRTKMPKYLVMENVRTLAGRYADSLYEFMSIIRGMGYICEAKVLSAADYGLPQDRKRLFMVGVRNDLGHFFIWPDPVPLRKRLSDMIDPGEPIVTINKDVAHTIRLGGRRSGVGNRHNWDGYMVNGKEYFLSAKDCLVLMGFDASDFEKLSENGVSKSKICKIAGNSVAVSVLEHLLKSLLLPSGNGCLFSANDAERHRDENG